MKILNNFVSVVALGNFNPAILTEGFLSNICNLDLGEVIDHSPLEIPVHRMIKFKTFELSIDLDRLTIKQTEIKEITEAKVLDIFNEYYSKLPYTPLKAVGVNINCNLSFGSDRNAQSFEQQIIDPQAYLAFFGVTKIDVTEKAAYMKSDKIWQGSNYRIETLNDFNWQINASKRKDLFSLNFNFEVGDLLQEPSKWKLLLNEYPQFCNRFLDFLHFMEG
jgi:hypothetical protein